MPDGTASQRRISRIVKGLPASDGAGVKMTRLVGTPKVEEIGPFLMLDHFGSDDPNSYIAGFPEHPHRGFETITLMLAGRMRHKDHLGNSGLLQPGHVQWMTAARGIIHSEMPEQEEGRMAGFQLWLNLPRKHKMDKPDWHDFTPEDLTNFTPVEGVDVKLVAGSLLGRNGPVRRPITEPVVAMLHMAPGTTVTLDLPPAHAAMLCAWEGSISVGGKPIPTSHLAELDEGETVTLRNDEAETARLMLAAAAPLNEPVVRYGPFVMSTEGEIRQAIVDFQSGRF